MKNYLLRYSTLVAAILCWHFSLAQNLVPNPSFEDTLGCPMFYPDLDGVCKNWSSFRATPDYMNRCSPVCGDYNQFGYQEPKSGDAYAGFAAYQITIPEGREHIGVQLSDPLEVGTKYFVSLYVSNAWNDNLTNIASNKLGALFTMSPYFDPGSTFPLPNTAHVYTDTIVKDTTGWFQVFGSFTADQTYNYLVIGSFFDDLSIDTLNLPFAVVNQLSYYYLDDVCVSADSTYCYDWEYSGIESLEAESFKIWPNPSRGEFTISSTSEVESVKIIDMSGRIVYQNYFSKGKSIKISLEGLNKGIYSSFIECANGVKLNERIIINQ